MKKRFSFFTYLLLTVSLLLVASSLWGQPNSRRADAFYEEGAYAEAIKHYEQTLKKGEHFQSRLRLARCFREVGEGDRSVQQYMIVVKNPGSLPIHKFEMAKVLKDLGKYEKAKKWFEIYAKESSDPALGAKWAASCDFARQNKVDSLGYRIIPYPALNTRASEISPVIYKAGIAFSSNRKRGFFFRFLNGYKRGAFYDLYYAEKGSDGRMRKPAYLHSKINTRFHDGPTTFDRSESIAFVTRSNMSDIGGRRDAAGYNRVSIYTLENRVDKWRSARPLPFSSHEYSIAHPSLSEDGSRLYFSSDMPGGFGGTDIWVSEFKGETWTRPKNLGSEVNSEANEGYPFLVHDSLLYFSSDRAEGFGGKDIFYAHARDASWTQVRNAGYPLNTEADDFGYHVEKGSAYGYFVSNRGSGKGDDDIFGFKRYKALEGTVVDSETGNPISGATIQVMDVNNKPHFYSSDADGNFVHYMQVGDQVMLDATTEDFHPYRGRIDLKSVGQDENKYVMLPLDRVRRFLMEGVVREAETGDPMDNVIVEVLGHSREEMSTDGQGAYEKELQPGQEYTVIFAKEGFIPRIVDLNTEGEPEARKYIVEPELRKGPFILLEGIVTDREKGLILPQANIHIVEANTQEEIQAFQTRKDGRFWEILDEQGSFSIIATVTDFLTARFDIFPDSSRGDTLKANLMLIPLELDKVAKVVYYDFDRSDIRIVGMRDLNEIAYFLMDNPEISVELGAHTDARGRSNYNLNLSNRRGEAAVRYLISRGIAPDRIRSTGFGEQFLVNDCGDGVDCDDTQHQRNRRTEVKIVAIDEGVKQEKYDRNTVQEEVDENVSEERYEKGNVQYKEEIRPR